MMAAGVLPLPLLLGIVETPVFAPPGVLVTDPGYQSQTAYFLYLPDGLEIPNVPEHPNGEHLEIAKRLLIEDLMGDFCFVDDADLAHAVVVLILPFVRLLIDGPTPLFFIESSTPGSGKGLLAEVVAIPALGYGPAIMAGGQYDEEWRKRITAKLLQAPQYILIDNVTSSLDSGALAAALTSITWEDRVLGHSRIASLPVKCVWLATGNNPVFSLEIARRTVPIRLDAGVERPWERTGFRHPDLRHWAKENRGDLICAALTLVQAWVDAGMPAGSRTLGSYERFAEVMGGILYVAGIPGFLENADRVYTNVDYETTEWSEFCPVWWEEYQGQPVAVELLHRLAAEKELLLEVLGNSTSHSGKTKLGLALRKMRDRVVGDFQIQQGSPDSHNKVQRYRLVDLRGVRGVAGGSSTPKIPSTPSVNNDDEGSQQSKPSRDPKLRKKRGQNPPQRPATPRKDPWDPYLKEVDDGTG